MFTYHTTIATCDKDKPILKILKTPKNLFNNIFKFFTNSYIKKSMQKKERKEDTML